MNSKLFIPFLIFVTSLLTSACDDVNRHSSIPYAPVEYHVRITQEYPHFVLGNGYQTMRVTTGKIIGEFVGYAGLLIWIGMDDAYHAADLCCPHCVKRNQPLEVDGIFAYCKLCGEHYDISYGIGNPTKNISKEALKRYNTSFRNMATGAELYVFN